MKKIIIISLSILLVSTLTSSFNQKKVGLRLQTGTYTGFLQYIIGFPILITMTISNIDARTGNISGYYTYAGNSNSVTLSGNSKKNGVTTLIQIENTTITGKLSGIYTGEENSNVLSFDGTWKSPDGKESYKFTVSPEMGDE